MYCIATFSLLMSRTTFLDRGENVAVWNNYVFNFNYSIYVTTVVVAAHIAVIITIAFIPYRTIVYLVYPAPRIRIGEAPVCSQLVLIIIVRIG